MSSGGPDHTLLFDADCGFCKRMLGRVMRWDRRGRVRAVPIQSGEGQELLDSVPEAERLDSWHLVGPEGAVTSGGAAGPGLLRLLPGGSPLAAVLEAVPGVRDGTYRWIAAHRELLGRFMALAMALVVVGCGSTVQEGTELTVYASVPTEGMQGASGRQVVKGMESALEAANGEAGGAPVELEVLDEARTQAAIADNARTATEDSTAIAYVGELSSGATLVAAPIINESGMVQVSPGPVDRDLLAEPGGTAVPREVQPTGERTLVTLVPEGDGPPVGEAFLTGQEAMNLILDSIDAADDPLSRASVTETLLASGSRESPLGTFAINPVGQAVYADPEDQESAASSPE